VDSWGGWGNVVADGSGTLSLSSTPVNMFPAGQSGDSPDEETAILTGSFTLPTLEAVTFQVGADDDGVCHVDGSLVESLAAFTTIRSLLPHGRSECRNVLD